MASRSSRKNGRGNPKRLPLKPTEKVPVCTLQNAPRTPSRRKGKNQLDYDTRVGLGTRKGSAMHSRTNFGPSLEKGEN